MAGSCISASGVWDFWKYLINSSFIFQHDNDPKNTANTVKTYWIEKYTIEHHQSLTGPLKSSTLLKQYEITLTENLKENNRYVNTILKTSRNLNNLGFFFLCQFQIIQHLTRCVCPLSQGAFWGLMAGLVIGLIRMVLEFSYSPPSCGQPDHRPAVLADVHYLYFALILLALTCLIIVAVSLATAPIPKENVRKIPYIMIFYLYSDLWSGNQKVSTEQYPGFI